MVKFFVLDRQKKVSILFSQDYKILSCNYVSNLKRTIDTKMFRL